MDLKLGDVVDKGTKLEYEYDFGSSTELVVMVMDAYAVPVRGMVKLLSRNNPPGLLCDTCGKEPATVVCSVCMYGDDARFCRTCAARHRKQCADFADYAKMKVVNSPRMGVCGYEGGSIDRARDGAFKKAASSD